jgi:hypothetical protein
VHGFLGTRLAAVAVAALAAALLAGLLLVGAGCGGAETSASQVKIVKVTEEDETAPAITPLERGKLRRGALEVMEVGIQAILEDDLDLMAETMADTYVEHYTKQRETYEKEGKVRVRKHEEVRYDLVDMNRTGTEALVEYNFTDVSYFTDRDGNRTSEPTGKETLFQFTLERSESGEWTIIRLIGGQEALQ